MKGVRGITEATRHVVDGLIEAVTEYCDTSYMQRVLFAQ